MEIRFDGKKALVTGGARGLGLAIAEMLAKNGADVTVADVQDEAGKAACEAICAAGGRASYVHTDVSDMAQVQQLYAAQERVDIAVHCVAIMMPDAWLEADPEKVQRLVNVNVMGTSNVVQETLRKMIPYKQGKFLILASIGGKLPDQTIPHYRMSKAAVLSMTMTAARTAAEHNINVNAICPGIIRTDMWEKQLLPDRAQRMDLEKEAAWDRIIGNIPMKRPQSPEDIANAAAFLCSDLAANITGQTLNVDGGSCMQL
ncbi:MAG: SDR family oxidoreductase [Oscillibacter sp.]|nr:SDR family oxidoreductase [Oscillibacter sp.]